MLSKRIVWLTVIGLALVPGMVCAQGGADYHAGLLARYSADGRSIERVDPDVSFLWAADAPDSRLPTGPFQAEWTSQLIVRQDAHYTFHAYVQGEVTIHVGGQPVLTGRREEAGWLSGPAVPLDFGPQPLRVTFRKTERTARLHLFWSSDRFALEPVPYHVLLLETDVAKPAEREQGRRLFDAFRCNRCHRRKNGPLSPPAPALTHIGSVLSLEWLTAKLQQPNGTSLHARMPSFDFTPKEARAIAAFLLSNADKPPLQSLPKPKAPKKGKKPSPPAPLPKGEGGGVRAEERRQGEILFRSVGCLACHTVGTHGHVGPYGGGDLSTVGAKRSARWLFTWLADPAKLNPDHRMPVFKLDNQERRQLALYLSGLDHADDRNQRTSQSSKASDTQIQQGRQLVEAARCAACHRIEGVPFEAAALSDLAQPIADWSQSCLQEAAIRDKWRPAYKGIDRQDREALKAFVESRTGTLSPESQFAWGQRLLERRNCLACHERGSSTGIPGSGKGLTQVAGDVARLDEALAGQSEALIPPYLTAVGDKLRDEALAEAVSGERKQVRLPWLKVRMPRFEHSATDKSALLSYLIGHDRIPEGQPRSTDDRDAPSRDASQTLVTGHTLVGVKGFNCIACHQIGDYVPRNVALGTRGSDLWMLGRRMRREFYVRWTRSPLRIVPGVEMPSYERPAPRVLGENVEDQLAATWDALNDPQFKPPTNPSAVEQFWTVEPGKPARIIRDVFTNPPENGGGYVARSFAVGLHNGHNVLFDLDTFALRQWTFGDFARQRTSGKSWYWDMAGIPVISGFSGKSDFALIPLAQLTPGKSSTSKGEGQRAGSVSDGRTLIPPKREHGTNGRLVSYKPLGLGIELTYRIRFEIDKATHSLLMTERILPAAVKDGTSSTGWDRDIRLQSPVPAGFTLLVSRPVADRTLGSPTVRRADAVAGSPDPATSPTGGLHQQKGDLLSDRVRGRKTHAQRDAWQAFPEAPGREFTRLTASSPASPRKVKQGRAAGEPSPVRGRVVLEYRCSLKREEAPLAPAEQTPPPAPEAVTSVAGYDGVRLPIPRSIMPTAVTWTTDGTLAFASLKGHVYLAHDTDGDGIEDKLTLFEEGLAAPYGLIADGNDLIVSHKPELLRLSDTDGDGRADRRTVVATGWGYNDNYHDWTCGIVRDAEGNLYVGLGSDYAQPKRPREHARWRGNVLRIDPHSGHVTPVGHSFRYPTGLAINGKNQIFVSDNQGVQNTFNEINYLVEGRYYGVPSRYEAHPDAPAVPPAIQVPHPWTRSVNGLFFLPAESRERRAKSGEPAEPVRNVFSGSLLSALGSLPFSGHGIGCELNNRFLVRFTTQQVGDVMQGAIYAFSRPDAGTGPDNFLGPLCGAVSPNGTIYIGSIYDSGWLGGQNVGDIVRLTPNGKLPNGIRELQATPDGFQIDFIKPVDPHAAASPDQYSISGYTRVWQGSYATPDSGQHTVKVNSVTVSDDAKRVRLHVDELRKGYVYDVSCGRIGTEPQPSLFPATGHFTLHRIPKP